MINRFLLFTNHTLSGAVLYSRTYGLSQRPSGERCDQIFLGLSFNNAILQGQLVKMSLFEGSFHYLDLTRSPLLAESSNLAQ